MVISCSPVFPFYVKRIFVLKIHKQYPLKFTKWNWIYKEAWNGMGKTSAYHCKFFNRTKKGLKGGYTDTGE